MKALGEMLAASLPESAENHGLMSAAEDMLNAIKSGDHKAFSDALCAHYGMYMGDEEGDGVPTGTGSL